VEQIEQLVDQIETDIRSLFVKEISSLRIGEMVIASLRQLDEVAYVRFASVYRNFRDKEEFLKELNQLSQNKQQEP
jgi:transcriptional repressor NrdR